MTMRAAIVDGVVTAVGLMASFSIIIAFGVYGSYTSAWMAAGLPLSIGAGYLALRLPKTSSALVRAGVGCRRC